MPHVEIPSAEFKVVLLGSSHIGKSSLVTRFSEGYYRENSRQPTVGAAFITKRITSSENVTCKVQIWDTAGAASFKPMAGMFYRDAAAVIVCYDVCSRESFEEMRGWLDELRVKTGEKEVVMAIAGLKADLLGEFGNVVPEREVELLADTLGLIYVTTSAKEDQNVTTLFQRVADQVLQNRREARIQKKYSEEAGDAVMDGENRQYSQIESRDATENIHPSGRDSPRRSKYDKKYKINTESESQATPRRTPKSKAKAKITVERKKRNSSRTPRRSKRDNTLLKDEKEVNSPKGYGCCQPVGCGAGESIDSGSGCIVS